MGGGGGGAPRSLIIAFQNKLTGGCRRDEQVEVQLPLIRHFRPFGQKISMNHQPITHAHVYMDNSIARVSTPAKIGQLRTERRALGKLKGPLNRYRYIYV